MSARHTAINLCIIRTHGVLYMNKLLTFNWKKYSFDHNYYNKNVCDPAYVNNNMRIFVSLFVLCCVVLSSLLKFLTHTLNEWNRRVS